MSASSTSFPPDHHLSPSEQLCYVHCNFCDTVLAVSVPCTSLFKTVTVRCGHCSNLLSVNMRGLLLPSANQLHLGHSFFTPQNLLEEIRNASSSSNMLMNQLPIPNDPLLPVRGGLVPEEVTRSSVANKPPEKRQRVPSAYNRFIKDEIQRIKAGNPDISHREAFSAAAKNWAHFPHIHFGLMPDHQPVKKPNLRQEGEDVLMKDGFFTPAATNVSINGNENISVVEDVVANYAKAGIRLAAKWSTDHGYMEEIIQTMFTVVESYIFGYDWATARKFLTRSGHRSQDPCHFIARGYRNL